MGRIRRGHRKRDGGRLDSFPLGETPSYQPVSSRMEQMGTTPPKRTLGVIGLCASLVLAACGRPPQQHSADRLDRAGTARASVTSAPSLHVDALAAKTRPSAKPAART